MSRREWGRRLVHVGLGSGAYLLPLVSGPVAAAVLAVATLHNAFALPRLPVIRLLLRAEGGGLRGLVLYPLVLLGLVLILRERHQQVVQAAWLALAVGDGLAPGLATLFRRPAWPWNGEKAVPASCAAFALAFVAMIPTLPLSLAAAGTGGGLLGETLPRPCDDNLMVPLFAAGAALAVHG